VRARAQAIPRGLLDCESVLKGNHVPCQAVAERDESLDTDEIQVHFGDGQHVFLVELVDAVRKNG